MPDETVMTITVQYKYRDGWHVFSSNDVPGLYVASKDARKAYEDVPIALKAIMDMDWKRYQVIKRDADLTRWRDAFVPREGREPQTRLARQEEREI